MAQPFPFIVRETTPPGRIIVLRGRSLPYRGVTWGGTQRVNINYFPGNPVATAQVVGPTYVPTVIRGTWKDAFLFTGPGNPNENAAELRNFPVLGPAALPPPQTPGAIVTSGGQTFPSAASIPGNIALAQRARTLRDAFEVVRRSGALLNVTWGSIARFGFLVRADFTHDREEDIAWELEFAWIGDTDAPPIISTVPRLDALGFLRALIALLQALLDAFNRALAFLFGAVQRVTQLIRRIGSLVTDFLEALNKLAGLIFVPAELFGTLQQQLAAIRLATRDLIATLRSVPAAYSAAASGATPTEINFAIEFAAAINRNAQILGVEAALASRQLDALQSDDVLAIYTSPGGVTLRDVATRFYGSPDDWPRIRDFNGLSGSVVERGTVIRVPKPAK